MARVWAAAWACLEVWAKQQIGLSECGRRAEQQWGGAGRGGGRRGGRGCVGRSKASLPAMRRKALPAQLRLKTPPPLQLCLCNLWNVPPLIVRPT